MGGPDAAGYLGKQLGWYIFLKQLLQVICRLSNDTCTVCLFKMATPFIRLASSLECNSLAVSKCSLLLG